MTSKERVERIALLKRQAELMRSVMSGPSVSDESLRRYHEVLTEIARIQRIEDGFQDILVFGQTYFAGDPPHNIVNPETPSPPFHRELTAELRDAALDPMMRKTAIAAPRSHSKTVWVTNIFPLWCICYVEDVREHYWLIIGDKQANAQRFLDVIKSEIEDNETLRADFGDLKGPTWNSLEIVTANNVKISAAGQGEALRGLRFGSYRPSVILDDVENDESTSTPERINRTLDWFSRTVLPLGDPKHSKFFLVGTVIHYDSLLNQVLTKMGEFKALKYCAIEQFPERLDMWSTFENILHDRSQGSNPIEGARLARQKAIDYYHQNRDEMDRGAKVLWPERMDLLTLMEIRATKRHSFNSEFQNNPIDEATRVFHTIKFYDPAEIDIDALEIYGAVDPSMGGPSKRADPSAIVTIGRNPRTGVVYVLEMDIKKRHPDEIIQTVFSKAQKYKYIAFSVETIAFQSFFRDEMQKRSAQQGVYLPIKEFRSTLKKQHRIQALEPLFSSGAIRLLPTQRDLIEQLEYYPKSSHDDAIDVVAQVMELVKTTAGSFSFGRL